VAHEAGVNLRLEEINATGRTGQRVGQGLPVTCY